MGFADEEYTALALYLLTNVKISGRIRRKSKDDDCHKRHAIMKWMTTLIYIIYQLNTGGDERRERMNIISTSR